MYDYYENYYEIPEEDLKTDFHFALDNLIDAEVQKRLEERIKDIDILRENQKQYDEKIAEANNKVKEAENKRLEADRARMSAERERDNTIKECEQSISDITQQKLLDVFGDWLNETYVYYLKRDDDRVYCPYCNQGKVEIKLPDGSKATTTCKVCNGNHRMEYFYYEVKSMRTEYPCFVKENAKSVAPYFVETNWYGGNKVALRDVMTRDEAEKKAKTLNETNRRNALKRFEERKKKLDEENTK